MPILPFFIYLFTYAIFIKKESVIFSSSVNASFRAMAFLKGVYGENKNNSVANGSSAVCIYERW